MLFNSIDFIVFFPVVVLIYFIIPKKGRCLWLLLSSYYFYSCWNVKYTLLIAISTIITYVSGLLIYQAGDRNKGGIAVLSLVSNLSILAVFKYADFFLQTLSEAATSIGFPAIEIRLDLLLPVGISFYTFQALSYTMDVYRGDIEPEKNIVRYALFVSFFPQLVAGPIERTKNLLPQIEAAENKNLWDVNRVREGLLLMFWGFFQKLVIADRASIFVNQVYDNYHLYGFIEIAAASILFSIQIYCDFGGYTSIARGAAKVMGFTLMQNFRQPYLAGSIKDFWRRWHVSLTTWFTDYLYIPLGGNRKGKLRKYLNILLVFTASGLWHGASWHFVAWGFIHAVFQIIEDLKTSLLSRIRPANTKQKSFSFRLGKIFITFFLVDAAWILFAADSISQALGMAVQSMKTAYTTSLTELGLDAGNWIILLSAIAVLFTVDILHEQGKSVFALINGQMIWYRWVLYAGLIWVTLMFGIYGIAYDTEQFIYFQF